MPYEFKFTCGACKPKRMFTNIYQENEPPTGSLGACWEWQRAQGLEGRQRTGCAHPVRWTFERGKLVAPALVQNPAIAAAKLAAVNLWKPQLSAINTQVRNWRAAFPNKPNTNAGENSGVGTCLGGENNLLLLTVPIDCKPLGISGFDIAKACAASIGPNWSFDGYSNSAPCKFRSKHANWQDVLIHAKLV
jgi:hypothetical protein